MPKKKRARPEICAKCYYVLGAKWKEMFLWLMVRSDVCSICQDDFSEEDFDEHRTMEIAALAEPGLMYYQAVQRYESR